MKFEWDERKNQTNIAKHGFDFADAFRIFNLPMVIELDEREDYGEDRLIGIGLLSGRVVVVVYTEPNEETVRIILYERHSLMNADAMNNTSKTDWARIDAMTDDDIDTSDIPALTEEFFEKATLRIPASQAQQLVHIEPDLLKWFQAQGEEYRALINSVLRQYVESQNKESAV